MISFYPGPSRVYDSIPGYVKQAHATGLLSLNHRSPEFEALYADTVALLKKKLNIPASYSIVFTNSATECWEVIAQSLVTTKSIHLYNGAFGEKWFEYTRKLCPQADGIPFGLEEELDPTRLFQGADVVCVTQNETSNGTQVSNQVIGAVKSNNPNSLIAVDATSSMAGIKLDFQKADIWFASVQKCFGLPAGLALMVLSPEAASRVSAVNENKHYNSLSFMLAMAAKSQTSYTPNVLGLYLLMRTLKEREDISAIHRQTKTRCDQWQALLKKSKSLKPYAANRTIRSLTVMTVKADPALLPLIKSAAKKKGFLLGDGYGPLKKDTFRIANFPALRDAEVKKLMKFLANY